VSAHWSLDQPTTMAITGSQILVQDGQVVASNDRMSAPRTAVGIDASTGHILLAALDGRQAGAAGLSTLAWADVLAGLGIGNALNLDGGGSTTMVARDALGLSNDVVNTPSLGYQRHLPDVLAVDYTPPAG
jgi:exopolysaccharide biosynthesis protein